MIRRIACFSILLLLAGAGQWAHAQDQNDPLTEDETQQVRDNAIHPNERIKLYLKFLEQRLDEIKQLSPDARTDDNRAQIRDKYEEFTHLCDELQDNLETYDSAHADIRKALKDLLAASAKWPEQLNVAPADPNYDFSHKTALEAAQSAAEEAKQLSDEQEKYFLTHKDERHKNGAGPD